MTHTWKITDLNRTIDDGLIHKVSFRLESQHQELGARQIYELELTGSASNEGFIAYEDLEEATVLNWLSSSIDQQLFEGINSQSIADNENHISSSLNYGYGTPWSI